MPTSTTKPLRYQQARETIANWIASEKFGDEGRLPPERILAENFDMNRRTVRRALADLVAEGVLYKQARAGCFVRPTRPSARRRIRVGRLGLVICVPLSRTFEEFVSEPDGIAREYLRGIAEAGRENNAVVEFQFVPPERHVAYLQDMVEQDRPHGIVLYDVGSSRLRSVIQRIIETNIPYVAYQPERSLSWETIRKLNLNYVTVDQQSGVGQAAGHLIGLGHRRIAYWEHRHTISSRLNGYRQAMRSAGIEIDELLIDRDFDFSNPSGKKLLSLIESGVTALVTSSDYIAMKVLADARVIGIDIPGRLSVTGFDNNPAAAKTSPPLTTAAVDRYRTGRAIAEALAAQHRHPDANQRHQIMTPVELAVRSSTASVGQLQVRNPF